MHGGAFTNYSGQPSTGSKLYSECRCVCGLPPLMRYKVPSVKPDTLPSFLLPAPQFANAIVILWLTLQNPASPAARGWQAAVYCTAEGPVAAALIAWQCAWVLGSTEHTTSVLLHLLPGLAMYCLHHLSGGTEAVQTPSVDGDSVAAGGSSACSMAAAARLAAFSLPGVAGSSSSGIEVCSQELPSSWDPAGVLFWHIGIPTALYLLWQLSYFIVVQVRDQTKCSHGHAHAYLDQAFLSLCKSSLLVPPHDFSRC